MTEVPSIPLIPTHIKTSFSTLPSHFLLPPIGAATHDRLCAAAFKWTADYAARFEAPAVAGTSGGGSSSAADAEAPPAVQPQPPAVPAAAQPPPSQPRSKLPIDIDGDYKATPAAAQADPARKAFSVKVPWHDQFKSGATLQFSKSEPQISAIKFVLSSDPSAVGRDTLLQFSLPSAFAVSEITLSGLQIVALAKPKKTPPASAPPPPDPPPQRKKKRAPPNNVPQPGSKKKAAAAAQQEVDIPADAVFVPPEGTSILSCPPTVDVASLKGKLIAHRFDKAAWAEVWATGGKALRRSADSAFFEVKYPGYRELYLHSLDASAYGPDKTWCLYG